MTFHRKCHKFIPKISHPAKNRFPISSFPYTWTKFGEQIAIYFSTWFLCAYKINNVMFLCVCFIWYTTFSCWYNTHFPCSFTKHTLSYLFVSNDPSHYFLSSSLMEGAHKLYINDGNNNACCTEWLYEHWTLWNKVKKIILPFSFYRKPVTTNAMIIKLK